MIIFRHRGKEFQRISLISSSALSQRGLAQFYFQIADMYLDDEKKKRVVGEGFEGAIKSDGRFYNIGGLGGINYKAEFDIDGIEGKVKISYLICERVNASLN